MTRCKIKNHKGFSLIESMVGVFIASGVFIVFLAILPKVIQTETQAQRTLIATNLAQEGIEMIRNLRDNNLKNNACTAFGGPSASGCVTFPTGIVEPSFLNDTFSSTQINMPQSIFTRTISISGSSDNRVITSTVSFGGKNVPIQSTLYAWGDK